MRAAFGHLEDAQTRESARTLLLGHARALVGGPPAKQVQAAEACLRQAEQETPPSPTAPPECATQAEAQASEVGAALQQSETSPADEQQERLHAIASDLLYWKGGLKVLRMAQLPKWRGHFKWQIEAKIEALQAAYATLRAEDAKPDG